MGGKSKKQTIGYKHNVGLHAVFCHGPIDKFSRVTVDDRVAWEGNGTGGQITINKPELFGGEDREGGVAGRVDIEMGGPAQAKNSYLLSKIGAAIPAYRGVAAMVFRDFYWGNNPYLKPVRARGQRIHVRGGGETQWYDEKAEIGIVIDESIDPTTYPIGSLFPNITAFANPGVYPGKNAPYPKTIEIGPFPYDTRICGGAGYPSGGSCRADDAFMFDGVIFPGDSTDTFDFDDTFLLLPAGQTVTVGIWNRNDFMTSGGGTMAAVPVTTPTGDMNPAHMIRECLTDQDWGMGYAEEDIDDDSFMAAADTLYSEGFGMSLLWDEEARIEDFVNEIIRHIDAALYVSRSTGKFVLKLIRFDYDPDELITLDESNVKRLENPKRAASDELINSVTVEFWDRETGRGAGVTLEDPAGVQMQGSVINNLLKYPGLTRYPLATRVCARDLRALSNPFFSCTVVTGDVAKDLEPGDVFKLSWGKWKLNEVVMRVTGFVMREGDSNEVRIECVEDVFATPLEPILAAPGDGWVDPSQDPTAAENLLAFEAPYLELVAAHGQTTVDDELTANSQLGFVAVAAARPDSGINAKMWTDAGGGFEDVDTFDFCPTGTLTAALGKKDEAATLENGEDLDQAAVGDHFQIGSELLRLDSIDAETGALTFGRGVLDTVPAEHEAGARAYFWDAYAGVDPTEYVESEEVDVRVTPMNGSGVLDLADAAERSVTLASRAYRPYPPGNLTINGDSYLAQTYDGELTVAWAHRDRRQQTSGSLADHFDGDIGPEAGTTYRVRVYHNGVEAPGLEQDEVSGTSAAVSPTEDGNVTIEVHSKRDGVYSLQGAAHTFLYIGNADARVTEEGDFIETHDGSARVTED